MRSFTKTILAAALFALSSGPASAAPTLNVHIQKADLSPVPYVTVAAIEFGMNGPSTYTQVGLTNASGDVTFTLSSGTYGRSYNLYYTSHTFSPTISDQFNNPEYDPNRYVWAMGDTVYYSTFTVTPGLADVGRVIQEFTGATANKVLFGGIHNMTTQMQGASGIVVSSADGTGFLVVDNVPYAEANTYNIGLYDPEKNKGIGRNVMTALGSSAQIIQYAGVSKLDFAESIPPTRVENNTGVKNTDVDSNVSVEGIVRSTETSTWTPIPWNGVNIQSCVGGNWSRVDENGRFQLNGLTPGVTYYVEAYGGCTYGEAGPGACYEPYRSPALIGQQDLCTGAAPKGVNDFVYLSSGNVQYVSIKLNKVPPGTGQIKVYVRSASGLAIPNANVNINPDHTAWSTNTCVGQQDWNTTKSNPGFANKNLPVSATGYVLLDELPSGNYMLNVWTPFSQNSDSGPSPVNDINKNGFNWDWNNAHCSGTGADDIRITVDTTTTPSLQVFDRLGNNLSLSSITVVVTTGLNAAGLVKGTLKFSSIADLTADPIMITLNPQCNDGGGCNAQGNFAIINSSGALSYNYAIPVSTGASYWMDVRASNWGRTRTGGGDSNVSLKSTGTVTVDMSFVPAGTITGVVYKPDGTVLTPSNNQWVNVGADTDNGWAGGQVQKDGTFEIGGALPGVNRIRVEVSGKTSLQYTLPSPAPTVTVTPGVTSEVNVNMVNANYVGIALDTTTVPDSSIIGSGWNTILGYRVVTLPAGSVLKGETITKMLASGGDDQMRFNYSLPTSSGATNSACGPNWPGGFCAARVPSPSLYDFYLMRSGDFGDMQAGPVPNAPVPHFVLLSSSKNVIVDNAHAISPVSPTTWNSTIPVSGVLVNLTPVTNMSSRGNATLDGRVTAANFFRQSDYDATGGDFDKFVEFLPVVTLYDDNGSFKAAGIVVPPMDFIAANEANFDLAFAQDYTAFKNLLNTAPAFVYEIRGLAPSACYTAVVTTPNYPPYQKRICLGVNNSTTTVNIALDSAVGAGATVRGVVKDTNTVVMSNIPVELSGEAVASKTVMTSTSGIYMFEGLPEGTVKIKVNAPGYALAEAEKDLVGTNTYPVDFSSATALVAAGGSISGTVYSQKLPFAKVQAGAQIMAYNDTYNGLNPTLPLPLLKTKTGSDGSYSLTGLVPGDTYKVFLKVPGKYTLNQSTKAASGNITGIDFTMLAKPLDIEIFAKKGADAFEFTVLNPQDFKQGQARWSAAPYSAGASTELSLEKLSSGELRGTIPLASLTAGITYELQGNATSYSNKTVTRRLLFGTDYKGNADQHIDDAIIGDDSDDGFGRKSNEAPMDKSGDNASALMFPAGAILPISSAAIPTCAFKGEDKDSSAVADKVAALGAEAFAGDLYTVSLSSVSINADKGFEITLAYDKSTADLTDLSVARYNDTTSEWENVPGVATINPVKGTVKVKLKSLASVLAVRNGSARPQFSTFNGREYVVRPLAGGSSSSAGTFAVVRPSIAGNAFAGTKMKVFNYPNPFNLKDKAISNNNGAALPGTVNGTVIHVEVPAGNGGPGHVRIYTLAGELVKDIKVDFTAGAYNYVGWDGHNSGGQEVANGVYYGVVEMSGKSVKLKDATFKMAVIK